jgi:hypothetical protein
MAGSRTATKGAELLAEAEAMVNGRRRPISVRLSDIEAERVSWLWHGYIPLGKVTVLDSDPGDGKSTMTIDIASRISTNSPMPDRTRSDLGAPADVIILSDEDGAADTIRPRADAAGANVERIHLLTDVEVLDEDDNPKRVPWLLPRDLDVLRQLVKTKEAKLVVIDPLSAYLDGKVDAYRDHDGRLRDLKETGFSRTACRG